MIVDPSHIVHNQSQLELLFYPLIISLSLSAIEFTSKQLIRNYLRIRALKPSSSRSPHLREPFLLYSYEFYICNSYS